MNNDISNVQVYKEEIADLVNAVEVGRDAVFADDAQLLKIRYEILLAAFTVLLQQSKGVA